MTQYAKLRVKIPDGSKVSNVTELVAILNDKYGVEAVCWGVLNPIKGVPLPEEFQLQPKYKRQ